jgi:DNA-binding Lrp family transcriptional regulator
LSATPCWFRLNKLKESGFIRAYRADIALGRIGELSHCHITVSLTLNALKLISAKQTRLPNASRFGPPIPIIRVRDIDHAIEVANSTAFGLSSGVCTNRMDDIIRFINELETGTVNIWEVPGYRIEMSPFGGIKDSGLGYKEGVIEAMNSYTNVKTFSLPW